MPAIVSIMIFWVLSPKSASLIKGRGFPTIYLDLSRIFYGFKSLWVILWLCNSWTPLLTWRIHSSACFSAILLSLHRLSASLSYWQSTKGILQSSTRWCTTLCQADQWCQIFLEYSHCLLSLVPHWCAFLYQYHQDQQETF